MAYDLVDRRADTLWKPSVVERRRRGLVLNRIIVHEGIQFIRCDTGPKMLFDHIQSTDRQSTCTPQRLDILTFLQTYFIFSIVDIPDIILAEAIIR